MIDLDNTLCDRAAAVQSWATEFAAERNLPAEAVGWIIDADQDGYADRQQVFEATIKRFGLGVAVDDLLAEYRHRVVQLVTPTRGAVQCLIELRNRGWTIAIVTNGTSGQQHRKIDILGLRHLVDAVCVSDDLGFAKPDRRMFETAASLADSDLAGSWMVGDSALHDIVGADEIGLNTAWLRRGRAWGESSVTPTVTIDTLDQLVSAIERAGAGPVGC